MDDWINWWNEWMTKNENKKNNERMKRVNEKMTDWKN